MALNPGPRIGPYDIVGALGLRSVVEMNSVLDFDDYFDPDGTSASHRGDAKDASGMTASFAEDGDEQV